MTTETTDKVDLLRIHTEKISDLITKMDPRQIQIFIAIKTARVEWLLSHLPCWVPEKLRKELEGGADVSDNDTGNL